MNNEWCKDCKNVVVLEEKNNEVFIGGESQWLAFFRGEKEDLADYYPSGYGDEWEIGDLFCACKKTRTATILSSVVFF